MIKSTEGKATSQAFNQAFNQINKKLFTSPRFTTTKTPDITKDINIVTRRLKI
jgi:hypothetical protein